MKIQKEILHELKEIKKVLQTIMSSLECESLHEISHEGSFVNELNLTEVVAGLLQQKDHQ